ncbi:hypothetical protein [Ktedonobacter robiniae]|nr:hypothetical protein [Ktedonobacter robiniae]
MKIPLDRSQIPAEALTVLDAWIEREGLLVDEREDMGGIEFSRADAKAFTPLPHIWASFFARRPYKRKEGYYPQWNGFYLLLYRDVEEGWKLERIRKNATEKEIAPMVVARSKAIQEIQSRFGSALENGEEE